MTPLALAATALVLFVLFFGAVVAVAMFVCWLARRAASVSRWVLRRTKPIEPAHAPLVIEVIETPGRPLTADEASELERRWLNRHQLYAMPVLTNPTTVTEVRD